MTVIRETFTRWNGLSTDTKPTPTVTSSRFYETDTGYDWVWDGTEWLLPQELVTTNTKKLGEWNPRGNVTTVCYGQMNTSLTFFGTNTASIGTSFGTIDIMDTGASINTLSGARCLSFCSRIMNPSVRIRFQLNHITDVRLFLGFNTLVGANPTSNADPIVSGSGFGLWFDSAVSADFKLAHNSGDATSTVDAFASPVTADTVDRIIELRGDDLGTSFKARFGTSAFTTITTDIPAQTTALGLLFYIENLAAASKTCYMKIVKTRSNP